MRKVGSICLLLILSYFAAAVHAMVVGPTRDREKYQARWQSAFRDYVPGREWPAAWKDEVTLRNLNDSEWVLAAIYHGGCAPAGQGEFNAMVLLDSRGKISTCNTSPCADTIENLASFWATLVPAKNLEELYQNQERWVHPADTSR